MPGLTDGTEGASTYRVGCDTGGRQMWVWPWPADTWLSAQSSHHVWSPYYLVGP